MLLNATTGPRTGTHPCAARAEELPPPSRGRAGVGGLSLPIDVRLHVPANAAMIDLVALITDLAERLGGYWDYHAPLSATPGRFELHEITLPPQEHRP